jgi:predicted SAM-dependent methyltransferase
MKMPDHVPDVPEGVNLNIGCGKKLWKGFINIDFPDNWSGRRPDIECDIRHIPLPTDYVDIAYSIHVLEHFYRWEATEVLKEWVRVLKPGGKLVVEVPCLDKILGKFNHYIKNQQEINPQTTMHRLYGDPRYKEPVMVHRWCYPTQELVELFKTAGLKDVRYSNPEYHHKECDMRVTGIK